MSEIALKDRKLTLLPSPREPKKDFSVQLLMAPVNVFPEEFMRPIGSVYDQEDKDMCSAFSGVDIREDQEKEEHGIDIRLSFGCMYSNRVPGSDWWGEGMFAKAMWQRALNRGVCRYPLFPEIGTFPELYEIFQERWTEVILDAAHFKIEAYSPVYREYVDYDPIFVIKNGLLQSGKVQYNIPVYESFRKVTKDNPVVPIPKKGEALLGYHAMSNLGYSDKERWLPTKNSWGPSWGLNGICFFPYEYPFMEAFVTTNQKEELPDDIKPDDKTDPKPLPKLYRVQVGAFKVRENADRLKANLASDGWPKTFITTVDGWFKVQTGAYAYKQNAEKEKERLEAKGFSVYINVY